MNNFEDKSTKVNGRWTKPEHQKFLLGNAYFNIGLELYGKNWKKIEELIGTRTGSQIRSHAQKFFLKAKPSSEAPENNEGSPDLNEYG